MAATKKVKKFEEEPMEVSNKSGLGAKERQGIFERLLVKSLTSMRQLDVRQ